MYRCRCRCRCGPVGCKRHNQISLVPVFGLPTRWKPCNDTQRVLTFTWQTGCDVPRGSLARRGWQTTCSWLRTRKASEFSYHVECE